MPEEADKLSNRVSVSESEEKLGSTPGSYQVGKVGSGARALEPGKSGQNPATDKAHQPLFVSQNGR